MNQQTFEHMAEELRPHLISIGREFFGDADRAEDVAQEVMIRLWSMHGRLDEGRDIRPLASRIAKNVCVSIWRQEQHFIVTDAMAEGRGAPAQPPDEMEDYDAATLERLAMSHLLPAERRLMTLRREEDMDIPLITATTGINPRSVSTLLSRARKKLMNFLKKGGYL